MPIVTILVLQGHDPARKTELLRAAGQAIEDCIGSPRSGVRVMLQELAPEHVLLAGQIGEQLVQYQVFLIEGRPPSPKAALIAALHTAAREILGVRGDQVRVVISEIPKTDIGLNDGITGLAAGR